MLKTNYQKIALKVKSFHPYYINMFVVRFSQELDKMMNVKLEQTFLPKRYERFTLLKSPHADKKAREQFERVTHKRLISILVTDTNEKNNQIEQFDKIFKLAQTLSIGVGLEFQFVAQKHNQFK